MKTDQSLLALDTNVLLRTLVEDNPAQTEAARRCLLRADSGEYRLFVSTVVLCELEWVLERRYRLSRVEIAGFIGVLLTAPALEIECHDSVARALSAYRAGKGDLSDYVIREAGRRAGCSSVLTFDKPLMREEGFKAP